ncbi:DMT family transporter [Nonomuraea sp. NPDC000554]|uniref:DMT family transporter n=1 Tax=Nonomuraea sp. NPDC000554 TaxID=3154259 RepID=UPI0033309B53
MSTAIAVILALCAAAANALSSVLQRRAARAVPPDRDFSLAVAWSQARQPAWMAGIGVLILAFLLQAGALSLAGLTLVQPILVTELPFTMFIVRWLFKTRLGGGDWLAVLSVTAGLAVLLSAANPSSGEQIPDATDWLLSTAATVGGVACLVAAARIGRGAYRPALLGVASGACFAFTAALMKESMRVLAENPAALLTTWPVYAMVAAGITALFLLQYALHTGTLVVVQPALTITDPVASIVYGVALFDDSIRLGPWVIPELAGVALVFYGSVKLSQSPHIRRKGSQQPAR